MQRDIIIIYICSLLRSTAIAFIGVIFGIYLLTIGLGTFSIGLIISAGFIGNIASLAFVSFCTERIGRKNTLLLIMGFTFIGGIIVVFAKSHFVLLLGSLLGLVNAMGRDRGAALAIEQAILPQAVSQTRRTLSFATYHSLLDMGSALGSILAGLPYYLKKYGDIDKVFSYKISFGIYTMIIGLIFVLYLFLSKQIELKEKVKTVKLTDNKNLLKLTGLFSIDSLGGGFLTGSLISLWFFKRFAINEAVLSILFLSARVMNMVSNFVAAFLAKKIGLVNTMVFTHIPSSLILMGIAFVNSPTLAFALFILREFLVEMDVPTRQSYLVAIVKPEERSLATGITAMTRYGCWSISSSIAGYIMKMSVSAPLVIGAGLKIFYDILLYFSMSKIKPPEEVKT